MSTDSDPSGHWIESGLMCPDCLRNTVKVEGHFVEPTFDDGWIVDWEGIEVDSVERECECALAGSQDCGLRTTAVQRIKHRALEMAEQRNFGRHQ